MKKRMCVIMAMLVMVISSTVCYADGAAARISSPAWFHFIASSSAANQHLMSEPCTRVDATLSYSVISPTTCTGSYSLLKCWTQYCGLDGYSTGTKCTNERTFQASQFYIYYTSNMESTGFFRFEGRSHYGIFDVSGNWSAG